MPATVRNGGRVHALAEGTYDLRVTLSHVVLTAAHLDHQPENCADENLLAGCQRCHNRYDAAH